MAGRFDEDTYARARAWQAAQAAKADAPKPAAKTPSKVRMSNPVSKQSMERAQDMRHMQDTISAAERATRPAGTGSGRGVGYAQRGALGGPTAEEMNRVNRDKAVMSDEVRKRTRARIASENKPKETRSMFGRNPRGKTPQQVRGYKAGGEVRGYGAAKKPSRGCKGA